MEANAKKGKNNAEVIMPYLFEFYNVHPFNKLDTDGTVLGRIVNSLREVFNTRHQLPQYIIIFLDKDIMEEINVWEPEKAMMKNFNDAIFYIFKKVDLLVRRRKLDITERNPGAIFGADLKIIYTKMMRRAEYYPKSSKLGLMGAARAKFNECINEAAVQFDDHVMNVSACNLPSHYDSKGKLSEAGKTIFWEEFDDLMERFDRNEIELLPPNSRLAGNSKIHNTSYEDHNRNRKFAHAKFNDFY